MKEIFVLKGAEVEVSAAPELIAILPLGKVVSSKGTFFVDEESLQAMKQQIAKRGVELVVDYEHQTLKGVQAPAAGWVKELYLKDGSIMARVEWTKPARDYLENKEYRYLSPVISVRKPDNKATGLHSLALTNTPAIEGMKPLVNSDYFEGDDNPMDILKTIAKLLGLEEDADEQSVLEALKTCTEENKSLKEAGAKEDTQQATEEEKLVANKAVCELLGLKARAATEDVTAKIMELKGGIVGGVNLAAELQALKKQAAQRDANDAVTLALKAGKLAPAQREWALSYALGDAKGFAAFVEKAPQVVPFGEIVSDSSLALKHDEPDEVTRLVLKQVGVSDEDLKKFGKV